MPNENSYKLPYVWPDLSAMDFKILCPGLSLAEHTFSPKMSDCFIAVNGAILKQGVNFFFWALGDAELFKTCVDRMSNPPYRTILWSHDKFGRASHEELAGWTYKTRLIYNRFSVLKHRDLGESVFLGYGRDWVNYTMFCAIALAVLCHAQHIDIYGADFCGEGYYRDDLKNAHTNHDRERWILETSMFAYAVESCAEQGIELKRITT